MRCVTPVRITAKRRVNGEIHTSGKMMVPCGKCLPCKLRRVNDWANRLHEESKNHVMSSFITLTYAPEFAEITPKKLMTVSKSTLQKFLKRLRYYAKTDIKYYAASEYGSKSLRPHYHIILFGRVSEDDVLVSWPYGSVYFGSVTPGSIYYTLKYITKPRLIPQFSTDDRVPEFSLMSKGLGKSYCDNWRIVNFHRKTETTFYRQPTGYLTPLPRYYREKIFPQYQRDSIFMRLQPQMLRDYERAVNDAGGYHEYYRQMGQYIRSQQKLLQKQHLNNHDKL